MKLFSPIFIKQQEKKLKEEKKKLEKELKHLAVKNKKLKDDWITKYPQFNSDYESRTDQIEEYQNLLPIISTLEIELQKINFALEKIKKGNYGICEKCRKPISQDRLNSYPQSVECLNC